MPPPTHIDTTTSLTPLALEKGMSNQSCPRHPVRMTNGDTTAVDVVPIRVDFKLAFAVQRLHCKGLVQLLQSDVVDV